MEMFKYTNKVKIHSPNFGSLLNNRYTCVSYSFSKISRTLYLFPFVIEKKAKPKWFPI